MNANQPTYNDILRLFQETERRSQETERMFQETERRFQETDKKFQETDKKFQKLELIFKETDRKLLESSQEARREIKMVNESIGRLGNRLGDFVEEMVRPAVVRLFQEQGIEVHEVHRGVAAHRDGDDIEIDLLVVNTTDVVAVECKSMLSIDDVKQHLINLNKLKKLLPTYSAKNVMGAVSAMVLPDNVARYAYKQGLFVIAQSGDHLLIRNDNNFKPNVW